MNEIQVEVIFNADKKPNGTKGLLQVLQENMVLHSDRIDIARTAFLNKLKELCPTIDIESVRQKMLEEVRRACDARPESNAGSTTELDISRIVRPHLFHVPEASGLLIPVAQSRGNERPEGKWLLCIQWADGRRECVDLEDYLDPGDGERIWFSVKPPAPLLNTVARWSQAGRAKWMSGFRPDLKELFQRIFDQFLDFLEFPKDDMIGIVSTLSLWTMLTYTYPVWPAVPYLSIGGPLGSGKSRVFDVLVQLVFNPLPSSNLTAACLFRTLHAQAGTLLLDEAEKLRDRTPDVGELLSILLAGYKHGGQATRLERVGDDFKTSSFDVYGPKAIAGISNLPPALASRCIPILMFRAAKDSLVPKRRIDPTGPAWTELRDDLHCMALAYGASVLAMADWQPDCADLNGRNLELWQPILAMATLIEDAGMDGLVETVEKHAIKSIESTHEEIVPEVDEILLRLLREMSQDKSWGVTANEVLQAAIGEESSLFQRHTARGVAAVFNRYGIKSRRSGGKRYFSATENQWKVIEQSYGLDLELREPHEGTSGNK
jgi:hypothetical protein